MRKILDEISVSGWMANIQQMKRMDRKTEVGAPLVGRLLSDAGSRTGTRGCADAPGYALQERKTRDVPSGALPVESGASDLLKKGSSFKGKTPKVTLASGKAQSSVGGRQGPRKARPLTAQRIRNIAENYIGQRECSVHMLREVLQRRLERYLREEEVKDADLERRDAGLRIEEELERLTRIGLVDDVRFAEMKARSWLSSGRGSRRILMELARKGIDAELARAAMTEASREVTGIYEEDAVEDREVVRSAEWEAADRFAQKKRIGRYRRSDLPEASIERKKIWRREAAAMARAGFEMDVIYQFLDGKDA